MLDKYYTDYKNYADYKFNSCSPRQISFEIRQMRANIGLDNSSYCAKTEFNWSIIYLQWISGPFLMRGSRVCFEFCELHYQIWNFA